MQTGNAHCDILVREAVAAERERCAKIADDYLVSRNKEQLATEVAARIRKE